MKKLIATLCLLALPALAVGPWVPVTVNTNTWECKPYHDNGTNYWNQLASLSFVSNSVVVPGVNSPGTTNTLPADLEDALFWWSFTDDTTSPRIWDNSGNQRHGTKQPTEPRYPVWADNAINMTLADENYLTSEAAGIGDDASAMTMSMWIKYPSGSTPATSDAFMVNGTNVVGSFKTTGMHMVSGPSIWRASFADDTTFIAFAGATNTFVADTWHHLVATYEKTGAESTTGARVLTYFDGTLMSSNPAGINFFVDLDRDWYVGFGESSVYTTFAAGNLTASFDDIVVDDAAWSFSTVTNVYTTGRSTAP